METEGEVPQKTSLSTPIVVNQMGMDVGGKAPRSTTGEYFRNNVWWWRPLADYCLQVAPEICEPDGEEVYWHTNDGDGLDDAHAVALSARLQDEIDSGRTAAFADSRMAELNAMPDETCDLCHGTGRRDDTIMQGVCNVCEGAGYVRPFATWYAFNVENVQEWVNFLRDCGGFEIW